MSLFLWIYALFGTLYLTLYSTGNEVVVQYSVGLLWLMMMATPGILVVLIFLPIIQRLRDS